MGCYSHTISSSKRSLDPEGSFMHSLYRHRYSVAGPQHLWHIDGNHKLELYFLHLCCFILDGGYLYMEALMATAV